MWLFVLVLVPVLVLVLVLMRWRRPCGPFPLVSPLPVLGCALLFRRDPVALLQALWRRHPAATLDLAGLRITVLLAAPESARFYRSRDVDSYAALARLGFADSLGELNLFHGPAMHARALRAGGILEGVVSIVQRNATAAAAAAAAAAAGPKTRDIYRMCREIVVSSMIEFFIGPKKAHDAAFCQRYLDFQLANEKAVAASMAMGRYLAWPLLWMARRQRQSLVQELISDDAVSSDYAKRLQVENNRGPADVADLLIGLLTAATKNIAIASASCIVFMLQEGATKSTATVEQFVLETLRWTALSIGALREIRASNSPWGPPGSLVAVSHVVMARDPDTFPERPLEFDPTRFKADQTDDVRLPVFGSGRHACPGRKIALACITALVQNLWPKIGSLGTACDQLHFDRPSLADRDYADVIFA